MTNSDVLWKDHTTDCSDESTSAQRSDVGDPRIAEASRKNRNTGLPRRGSARVCDSYLAKRATGHRTWLRLPGFPQHPARAAGNTTLAAIRVLGPARPPPHPVPGQTGAERRYTAATRFATLASPGVPRLRLVQHHPGSTSPGARIRTGTAAPIEDWPTGTPFFVDTLLRLRRPRSPTWPRSRSSRRRAPTRHRRERRGRRRPRIGVGSARTEESQRTVAGTRGFGFAVRVAIRARRQTYHSSARPFIARWTEQAPGASPRDDDERRSSRVGTLDFAPRTARSVRLACRGTTLRPATGG